MRHYSESLLEEKSATAPRALWFDAALPPPAYGGRNAFCNREFDKFSRGAGDIIRGSPCGLSGALAATAEFCDALGAVAGDVDAPFNRASLSAIGAKGSSAT